MRISTSVSAGSGYYTDSVGPFYPLFARQDKSICACLHSNITEFRNIKIGIVDTLPNAQEIHRIARRKPVRNDQASCLCILVSRHVCERDVILCLLLDNYYLVIPYLYSTFLCHRRCVISILLAKLLLFFDMCKYLGENRF